MSSTMTQVSRQPVSEQEAYEIGIDAYHYFYSLLTMEVTRRQMTNLEPGKMPGFGPMNVFTHVSAYPDADFRAVVRPNFDTLYSISWLDLTTEPMIISVPDTNGRYYLLPLLDMWTDVFAVPGWRTTGTKAQHFAVVPPSWTGTLPKEATVIDSPTSYAWVIGRTKTDGPDDYAAVGKIQNGMTMTPLSQWGKQPIAPTIKIDPNVDMKTPPLEQVNNMPAAEYFGRAAELLKVHPPHISDWSILARLQRIGFEQGDSFDMKKLDTNIQHALERGAVDGLKQLQEKAPTMGRSVNGWQMNTDTMGVYGNFYLKRAIVAMVGLGANQPEDAIYPLNNVDADGKPLDGNNKYVLHFNKEEMPPVAAFWSLTMYDQQGFQSANSINRFAISSWMPLKKNSDGSLDLFIQHENPGPDKESNWLPAPKGLLGVTMRLYAPKAAALYGDWNPPAIKRSN